MNYLWRALQGFGIIILIALMCGAVYVGSLRSQWNSAARDLPREEAACREAGIPLTPAELQASLPEANPNAAPDWQALTVYLKTQPVSYDDETLLGNCSSRKPHTSKDEQKARALLRRRSDLLRAIYQATDKSHANFHRDWGRGPSLLTPEYATMREAARVLRAEAYLDARGGREAQALDTLKRGFRVAQHAADDGSLIAYLVGNAADAITLSGAEDVLRADPASANRLGALIVRNRPQFSLRRAMGGEVILAMGMVELIRSGQFKPEDVLGGKGTDGGAFDSYRLAQLTRPLWDAGLAIVLRYDRRIIGASSLPYPGRSSAINTIEADFARNSKTANARQDFTWILPTILLPIYSNLGAREQMMQAKENVTMAAAGIVAYRRSRGAYPAGLSQVGRFTDPFSGELLRYRPEGKSFIVYSVGPTGRYRGQALDEQHHSREAYFRG